MENKQGILTKNEYLITKEIARKDAEAFEVGTSSLDKYNYATKKAQALFNIPKDDRRIIYVNTFVLPNDEDFISVCKGIGGNVGKIAEALELDSSIAKVIVTTKIMEINKYYRQYIKDDNNVVKQTERQSTIEEVAVTVADEKSELSILREQFLALQEEMKALQTTNKDLVRQNKLLLGEKETLANQNTVLAEEKETLANQNTVLAEEKDLLSERNKSLLSRLSTVNALLMAAQNALNEPLEMRKEK